MLGTMTSTANFGGSAAGASDDLCPTVSAATRRANTSMAEPGPDPITMRATPA